MALEIVGPRLGPHDRVFSKGAGTAFSAGYDLLDNPSTVPPPPPPPPSPRRPVAASQ